MKYLPLSIGIILGITLLFTEMQNQKLEGALLCITGMIIYAGFRVLNSTK